ncbi:MAG TPA: hypothetical protein VK872_08500 [Draconibacterium sp.]|jgi:hypothetical protein|nr:hypothetical protein [Draconibacterium sp.]
MKTKQFLFTFALVAFALVSGAVEKPKMNVIPLSDEKALIAVANEKPAYFELSILSEKGDLVYYKESSSEITDFRQLINYSNLENGNYSLKLKVNNTYVSRNLAINNNEMIVGETKMMYAPYFALENDILKLSFLNFDEENMKFRILQDGELVFENRLGNEFVISEGFDISKLEKGNYEIELSSYKNQFSYNIEK